MAGSVVAPIDALTGTLPPAAGDALGSVNGVALDVLNRAYTVDLSTSLRHAGLAGPIGHLASPLQETAATEFGSMTAALTLAASGVRPRFGESARKVVSSTVTAKIGPRTRIALTAGGDAAGLRDELRGGATNSFLLTGSSADQLSSRNRRSAAIDYRLEGLSFLASAETGRILSTIDRGTSAFSSVSLGVERSRARGSARFVFTRLREADTLLGGSIRSIYSSPGSSTYFLDADVSRKLGRGWVIAADYRRGWTAFSSGRLTTSAFSADLTKFGLFGGDQIAFRVAQPLRVETGGLNLVLPTSWDYGSETSISGARKMSLRPSGREIAWEAAYLRSMGKGFAGVHLFLRRDPGHVTGSPLDVGAAVRARLTL